MRTATLTSVTWLRLRQFAPSLIAVAYLLWLIAFDVAPGAGVTSSTPSTAAVPFVSLNDSDAPDPFMEMSPLPLPVEVPPAAAVEPPPAGTIEPPAAPSTAENVRAFSVQVSPGAQPPGIVAAPSAFQGLRVWSNGDSTSYFMSLAVIQSLVAVGAVPAQPAPEYKISSGLMSPGFFDWPAYIQEQLAGTQPDIVVFMVGANDARVSLNLDEYRRRVGALMDEMRGPDRRVVWVGEPNMARPDLTAALPMMNAIFQEEAGVRPWVTYVDTWAITSDGDGAYQQFLPDANGELRQIRADDGVHFTPYGGRRLAQAVIAALANR